MSSVDAEVWLEACSMNGRSCQLKVWTLTDFQRRKVVKNKWVFKKKADGRFVLG